MKQAHRRHDISDNLWHLLEPHLPGQSGQWGGIAKDNRQFINAVFWILRTGTPWRDLPPDYGDWKNTHRRFCRLIRNFINIGIWLKMHSCILNGGAVLQQDMLKIHPHS